MGFLSVLVASFHFFLSSWYWNGESGCVASGTAGHAPFTNESLTCLSLICSVSILFYMTNHFDIAVSSSSWFYSLLPQDPTYFFLSCLFLCAAPWRQQPFPVHQYVCQSALEGMVLWVSLGEHWPRNTDRLLIGASVSAEGKVGHQLPWGSSSKGLKTIWSHTTARVCIVFLLHARYLGFQND